jgi:SAM-dependent methyltransferase
MTPSMLSSLIAEHPLYKELSKEEAAQIAKEASSIMDRFLDCLPEEIRTQETARLEAETDESSRTLLEGVNGLRTWQGTEEFYAEVNARYAPLQDERSIHLELGTYVAWPKEKTDQHVAASKIGDFIRLDMNTECPIDVAASVTALPFHDETVDRISSNSLFEHCAYPHEIIKEAFRVLRPGGQLMTVAPFHFVEHKCPADYLRFTPQFFEDVCRDAGFETVLTDSKSSSGVYYTLHQFIKASIAQEATPVGAAARRAHVFMTVMLGLLRGFDGWFHAHGASFWHSTSALAVKPGKYTAPPKRDRSLPFVERYKDALICPKSGQPLVRDGDVMKSKDGANRYPIEHGVPNLFVLHGFGSSFMQRASSRNVAAPKGKGTRSRN